MTNKKYFCPICHDPLENIFLPLCRNCNPSKYEKSKYPHQKLRQTKRWKTRRESLLKNQDYRCQMCNKKFEKGLCISHVEDELHSAVYFDLWDRLINERIDYYVKLNFDYFESFIRYHHIQEIKNNIQFFLKKNSKKYEKIIGRLREFIFNPAEDAKTWNRTIRTAYELTLLKLIRKLIPLFYEESIKVYEKEVKRLVDIYLNTEKVMVLCKKCHYAHEKGMKLCDICKQNYHKLQYNYCYRCRNKNSMFCPQCHILFNQLDSEICPKCGKLYFQDNKILQSILRITADELQEQQMEGDFCLLCKKILPFDRLPNYLYFTTKENKHFQMGFLCDRCVERVNDSYKREENDPIQIKIENDPIY